MAFSGEHDDYFLVIYDDHQGNIDTEGRITSGIVRYLKDNGFKCCGGYWSMPWYWIDIRHKFFLPGRPGIVFGKVVGNHAISYDEFKIIYSIYKKYEGLPIMKFEKGVIY